MDNVNKVLTAALTVGQDRVVAASQAVRGNQRRIGTRHTLELYNISENIVFYGGEDVTVDNGMPILPNERRTFPVDDPYAIWLVAERESKVRMAELCGV